MYYFPDDREDKQDIRILNELENIDDELEKEGIVIVRMDNENEAKEYGIDHLPTLVYFEENIPAIYEGDLMNEDEVLEWLIEQKNSATIEEVTDEILTDLIEEHEYVVVYFSKYSYKDTLSELKSRLRMSMNLFIYVFPPKHTSIIMWLIDFI